MKKFFSGFLNLDTRLFVRIYRLSGKRFSDHIFYGISRLGDGWIYAVILGLFFIVAPQSALSIIPAAAFAFAIESVIYLIIKKNVKRIRPFKKMEDITSLIIPPDEFSFPSGHTAAATVFTVLFGTVCPVAIPFLVLYTTAVGFSRVYNGVHYPGDVFAGAALGGIAAKIGLFFFY